MLSNETGGDISGTPVLVTFLQFSLLVSVLRDIINLGYLWYLTHLMNFTYLLYAIRSTTVS